MGIFFNDNKQTSHEVMRSPEFKTDSAKTLMHEMQWGKNWTAVYKIAAGNISIIGAIERMQEREFKQQINKAAEEAQLAPVYPGAASTITMQNQESSSVSDNIMIDTARANVQAITDAGAIDNNRIAA
jgi:hypothetical protein